MNASRVLLQPFGWSRAAPSEGRLTLFTRAKSRGGSIHASRQR